VSKKRSGKKRSSNKASASRRRTASEKKAASGSDVNLSGNVDAPRRLTPGVLLVAFLMLGAVVWFLLQPKQEETVDDTSPPTGPVVAVASESRDASLKQQILPGLENRRFDSVVRGVADREDPLRDGWESEHFSELAGKQLKAVGQMMIAPDSLTDEQIRAVATDSFRSVELRPSNLEVAYQDQSIEVSRAPGAAEPTAAGVKGFREVIQKLAVPLAGKSKVHFKFKIVRVELQGDHVDTTAYFQISGESEASTAQINSTWQCRWLRNADHPLLAQVAVEKYEEVVYRNPTGGPMFADCTESVFARSDRFQRQLRFGIDYWTDQFDGAIARPAAGHGIAVGDVNGDGLEDLYLCQSPALPNLLLLQNEDGTVRDAAVESGVNWLEGTRAALLADLDNDGDQDLVAVLGSKVVVQANDGTGKFKTQTIISTPSSLFAINAVDYDQDSDLDLFICGYTLSSGVDVNDVFANPMPFHDANNGAPNVMLRNDGNWSFTDVTKNIGLDENGTRFSYASAWEDFDHDGDMDLYIANDFGRNNLYRNDNGKFTDVAPQVDVEDIGPGMSADWGDYNNDGHPDIYVSNMFSSAGNRITHQEQFKTDLAEETKQHFRRHARGNSLFENQGDGTFHDRSVDLGVTLGRWAWGSLFVDLNNDGWEDLYVTNGFITADNNNDL